MLRKILCIITFGLIGCNKGAKVAVEAKPKEKVEEKKVEVKKVEVKKEVISTTNDDAERKAKEEAERKAKEEAERKAKEEAERKAKVEAERKTKEEAERKAKEEAERKAKEEAELAAKEEVVVEETTTKREVVIDHVIEQHEVGASHIEDLIRIRESYRDFAQLVMETIMKHKNEITTDLAEKYGVNQRSKNINRMIISKILKDHGDLETDPRFDKAHIKLKTIRLNKNDIIENPMSFPAFKFTDLVNESWDNSETKILFTKNHYIFTIFKNRADGKVELKDVILWNMPEKILEDYVGQTWKDTVSKLKSGHVVDYIDDKNKRHTAFPHNEFNGVCFVATHAHTNSDTLPLPVKDKLTGVEEYTKQSFWLTRKFLRIILGLPPRDETEQEFVNEIELHL